MDPVEAFAKRDQLLFLDVREYYQWTEGSIRGAVHMPVRLLSERYEALDVESSVVVICQIGQRSDLATNFLKRKGFTAHNLEGGIERWLAEGFPLVSVDDREGRIVDGWAQFPKF